MASLFLALPAELRNEIYRYAIQWPEFSGISKRLEERLKTQSSPCNSSYWKTPSLLLLNRQIFAESQHMPFDTALVIDTPLPFNLRTGRSTSVTDIFNKNSLRRLRFVVLKMDLDFDHILMIKGMTCWLELVKDLFEIWSEANCIERLEVRANYTPPDRRLGWSFQQAHHHRCAMDILSRLREYSEFSPVEFVGRNLPNRARERKALIFRS